MKFITSTVIVYAVIVAGGGVFGYATKGSVSSLVMGTFSAVALLACLPFIYAGKKPGYVGALGIAIVLDAFFTFRFIQSFHFFPGGIMSIISLAAVGCMIAGMRKATSPRGTKRDPRKN